MGWGAPSTGTKKKREGTESAAFFSGIYGSSENIKRNDARPHPRTNTRDGRMARAVIILPLNFRKAKIPRSIAVRFYRREQTSGIILRMKIRARRKLGITRTVNIILEIKSDTPISSGDT